MLTIGAPASSTEARHSSTDSFSLMVDSYSRMRPQPVQVRLQACSGSSISTSGKRFTPDSFLRTMYAAMSVVRLRGNRMLFLVGRQAESAGVARQRHEREVQRVQMIFQVKHLGEAGAGERLLVPRPVRPLRFR